jgi:hypothetical protein
MALLRGEMEGRLATSVTGFYISTAVKQQLDYGVVSVKTCFLEGIASVRVRCLVVTAVRV